MDIGNRVERTYGWDDTSLEDYPTEDIFPNNLLEDDVLDSPGVPVKAGAAFDIFTEWITEITERTRSDPVEHGFYLDAYSNVIGIFKGKRGEVTLPVDYSTNRALVVHTHPSNSIVPSVADFELLSKSLPNGSMGIVGVPPKSRSVHMVYLNKTDDTHTDPQPREEVIGQVKEAQTTAIQEWSADDTPNQALAGDITEDDHYDSVVEGTRLIHEESSRHVNISSVHIDI